MPTYQYRCRECGHELEVVQAFTDDPLAECPSCAGTLRKVFSAVGITFKGSGFYKTDSRGGSGGAGRVATAEGSAPGAGSSDTGTSATGATTGPAPAGGSGTSPAPSSTPSAATA